VVIKRELIGEMCNNISHWVKDLKYCPARWGLYRAHYGEREGGVYSDTVGQSHIPRDGEFVISGVGQQRLF